MTRAVRRQPPSWGLVGFGLLSSVLVVFIVVPIGVLVARGIMQSDILGALRTPFMLGAIRQSLGRRGPVGAPLNAAGVDVAFTTAAVVLAQLFVAAPFYLRAAKAGFQSVDPRLEAVSATLGARGWRTFRRITVPLALPSLASGAVMCWARALGEFGATIMFAGNVAGRTQTMPLAILEAMETDVDAAVAIAVILIGVALAVLLSFRVLAQAGARAL